MAPIYNKMCRYIGACDLYNILILAGGSRKHCRRSNVWTIKFCDTGPSWISRRHNIIRKKLL